VLWLLDGALQAQPFMFTRGFATQVIAHLQLLPGQNSGPALATLLRAGAGGAPHWLASLDTSLGSWASRNGTLAVSALAATELLVGVGALSRWTRTWSVAAGLGLSIAIWVIGRDLGALYSGKATDPNSAPLIALMAVALLVRYRTGRALPCGPTGRKIFDHKEVDKYQLLYYRSP
jgi:hypothetical protein